MRIRILVLCMASSQIALGGAKHQHEQDRGLDRHITIGFTVMSDTVQHYQGRGAKAAVIEGTLFMHATKLLPDPCARAGTSFGGWLRDRNAVVVCTRVDSKGIYRVDSFVVNPITGSRFVLLVLLPKARFRPITYTTKSFSPFTKTQNLMP
jgi:hypothetical protein